MIKKIVFWVFFLVACASMLWAAPFLQKDVPAPLSPWIKWVLHGNEKETCPVICNSVSENVCVWPSRLRMDVEKERVLFSQEWKVYRKDTKIVLPGSEELWPQEVAVNGSEVPVGADDATPFVLIEKPGNYRVAGVFYFETLPAWIAAPPEVGLVQLFIDGRQIDFPLLDNKGRLWLKQDAAVPESGAAENNLQLEVHRLIQDEIPMKLITRLQLYVSGKHRKVNLGRVGVDDFVLFDLESQLPVKIERNGEVQLQVRPGKWTVEITTRHKGPVYSLKPSQTGQFGKEKEIWSFDARNHLRIVEIKGVTQIDPHQTTMPETWKQFPAYLVHKDDGVNFEEKKRGDSTPPPDKLHMVKTLRLDFDGEGYSVRDRITGTMNTGWRLNIDNESMKLGRVMLNSREQFITKYGPSGKIGVEMRYGDVDMVAESRINHTGKIPVTGWDRSFLSVKGELNLPPGWSLFDTSGIDNIRDTWLKRWSLLDMFLVLLIAFGVFKLRGWRWGVTALAALVLINNEAGAPCWVWLNLLAATALLSIIPRGRAYGFINLFRVACIVFLIVVSLPFMVTQVRNGIYPQLAYSRHTKVIPPGPSPVLQEKKSPVIQDSMGGRQQKGPFYEMQAEEKVKRRQGTSYPASGKGYLKSAAREFDADSKIQTGPGVPTWQWGKVRFSWNGPVQRAEGMSFVFISPLMNLVLSVARVILLAALIYGLSGIKYRKAGGLDFSTLKSKGFPVLLLVTLSFVFVSQARAHQSFPPQEFLKELEARLTEEPEPPCAPQCASVPDMHIEIDNEQLDLIMAVHSLYHRVAVPLPGGVQQWLPEAVLIDGKKAEGIYRDPDTGRIWADVPEGIHRIDMKGMLPPRRVVQLAFPLKPRRLEVKSNGWSVKGLHDNGIVDNQLQFTRIRGKHDEPEDEVLPEGQMIPSFVTITRTFHLGLNWRIETVAERATDAGNAVVLSIPLLAGESVTSDVAVKNGKVLLNMPAGQERFGWVSSLKIRDQLNLKAADTLKWVEIWKVNIGRVWHGEINGIPAVHHKNRSGRWFPQWRPWPGEKVTINISRPGGVSGQTYTIENTNLYLRPGQRVTNADLSVAVRSSRGSSFELTLPENAYLQSVIINGKSQSIQQKKNKVTLPLTPGRQQMTLNWRESRGIKSKWQTSSVSLGIPSVDSHVQVKMPRNRWILFCTGPYVGPAVLFWSSVIVIVILSFGLSRLTVTPLRFHHWILLGIGLTQASLLLSLPVAVWLLALGYRKRFAATLSKTLFNTLQVLLPVFTLAAFIALVYGIQQGLLGYPDMQIAGNGSHNYFLKWYQDISGSLLPRASVFSLPMWFYRVLLLAWALWIAVSFVRWLLWGWTCYSSEAVWRPVDLKRFRRKKNNQPHEKRE